MIIDNHSKLQEKNIAVSEAQLDDDVEEVAVLKK